MLRTFYGRLSTIFLLLILGLGAGWVAIAIVSAGHLFDDVEQLLNRGYAQSIASELSPLVASGFRGDRVTSAIHYMMVLNPMVSIYLLDSQGRVSASFTNPAEPLARSGVNLSPVLKFISSGGREVLKGDDPLSATRSRPFSAAPLMLGGDQGFVYIILGGARYDAALRMISQSFYLRAGLAAFLLALASTLVLGFSLFFLVTRRLRSLSESMAAFQQGELSRRLDVGARDELGTLARSFNQMAETIAADMDKLKGAERMRRELVENISHDLRSPLTSLQGYLETILRKDPDLEPAQRREFLEISLRNASSLRRLVEDLFELARLDARQILPRREPFQVAELAQDVVLKLAPQARSAGVTVTTEPGPDLPLVWGDIALIERVLTNLLENAISFTPASGSTRVEMSRQGSGVRIAVCDTGPGIPAEELGRIFERFYRTDASRSRSSGGAGLGLAIARQIVELHGGALEVTSRPGQGSSFSFRLEQAG
ncbi:MAG TPA: HAMP domain-containing sensor histidine kinase [Spirochaetia bacterium]|nr:HAMP domain-containing sensor histidine kinase [Spirochaetia bacterium]